MDAATKLKSRVSVLPSTVHCFQHTVYVTVTDTVVTWGKSFLSIKMSALVTISNGAKPPHVTVTSHHEAFTQQGELQVDTPITRMLLIIRLNRIYGLQDDISEHIQALGYWFHFGVKLAIRHCQLGDMRCWQIVGTWKNAEKSSQAVLPYFAISQGF